MADFRWCTECGQLFPLVGGITSRAFCPECGKVSENPIAQARLGIRKALRRRKVISLMRRKYSFWAPLLVAVGLLVAQRMRGAGVSAATAAVRPVPVAHNALAAVVGGATPNARMEVADPTKLTVVGGLARDTVKRLILRQKTNAEPCYRRDVTSSHAAGGAEGHVAVQFTIAPTGDVSHSRLHSSSIDSPKIESCILRAVARWSFPKPKDGGSVRVHYPFVISSATAEE